MAAGESPKVAISSPAQYCGLRLRRGTRIRELPEEHEVLRRWCEALGLEYRGQRLAGLAHEIFLKLLKAKREVPGAAERQKTLAAQDGKRALCGCGLTAGTCELDHVVPVRQAFAGSVQTLQALCGDCHSEKTLRESAQPTSLESRVAPGVMEYARPQAASSGFEAQALYVGVDVVRCRRNGLANAPFPLPILRPADGVEPVDGVLPDLGFVEGCCDARQSCLNLLPYVGPAGTRRFRWPRCWTWASAAGATSCWASPRGATWTRRRCGARWSAWTPRGPKARSTWPSSA